MTGRNGWFIGLALISVAVGGWVGASPGQGAIASTTKPRDAEPFLFAEKIPNSREWAEAANFYIALGERAGLARLKADAAKQNKPLGTANRASHLCRVLFEPKGGKPLRQPYLGALSLPYETMPLKTWPELPMVAQDGVWFILAEGYTLFGHAEPLDRYIAYCQKEGRFRTIPLRLPTAAEATAAVKTLLGSERWKAVKWSYESVGHEYYFSPDSTVDRLREQAKF